MSKYLFLLVLALFLTFLQFNIIGTLGSNLTVDILLVSLVFITIVFGFNLGFIWALYLGIICSIYSFLPFGVLLIVYLLVVLAVNFLSRQVFINFSIYTALLLMAIAAFLYNLLIYALALLFYYFNVIQVYLIFDTVALNRFVNYLVINCLLMALLYLVARLTYKRLNLVFLSKK